MKLVTIMTMLVLAGCGKLPYSVSTVDCDEARVSVIHDAMREWNAACGVDVFAPSSSGTIKVFCSDKEYMWKQENGRTVSGFYNPNGGYIALPKMGSSELFRLLVEHELGHVLRLYDDQDGGHSDAQDSVMYWSVAYSRGITEADIAEARRAGWECVR